MEYVDFRENDYKAILEDGCTFLINVETNQKEFEVIGFVNSFLLKVISVTDRKSIKAIPKAHVIDFNLELFEDTSPEYCI